jgi:hypothetical protein
MKLICRTLCRLVIVTTVAVGPLACNRAPTDPSSNRLLRADGLHLEAPTALAPGESATLAARFVTPRGVLIRVDEPSWTVESFPSGATVLDVSNTGVATARGPGRARVVARAGEHSATATILVLSRGTFHLSGAVTAAGTRVEGASVAMISGVGAGLTAQSGPSGEYELFGVAGIGHMRVSKPGFLDRSQEVHVTAHASVPLELTPANGPPDSHAGLYTLVVSGGRCTSEFPAAETRRVYTAQLEQTGADLWVSLSGSGLLEGAFPGLVTPAGGISFAMGSSGACWEDCRAGVSERLRDGTTLMVYGTVAASRTPAGIMAIGGANVSAFMLRYPSNYTAMGPYMPRPNGDCRVEGFEMIPR